MQTRGSLTVLQRTSAVTLKSKLACMLAASLSFAAVSAQGATMLSAELTTTQEPPPIGLTTGSPFTTRPTPSGFATFVLNDAMTALTFSATIFNIDVNGFINPGAAQTPYTTDDLRQRIFTPVPLYPLQRTLLCGVSLVRRLTTPPRTISFSRLSQRA